MEFGVMRYWVNVSATNGIDDEFKIASILFLTNIPTFHNSIIPLLEANSKAKNIKIINKLYKFRDV
jgi:hypothetical protein